MARHENNIVKRFSQPDETGGDCVKISRLRLEEYRKNAKFSERDIVSIFCSDPGSGQLVSQS